MEQVKGRLDAKEIKKRAELARRFFTEAGLIMRTLRERIKLAKGCAESFEIEERFKRAKEIYWMMMDAALDGDQTEAERHVLQLHVFERACNVSDRKENKDFTETDDQDALKKLNVKLGEFLLAVKNAVKAAGGDILTLQPLMKTFNILGAEANAITLAYNIRGFLHESERQEIKQLSEKIDQILNAYPDELDELLS